MGDSRYAWSENIAARCEAVGFVVTQTKEGYRVLGPEGETQGWHRTITPAAKRKVMSTLNRWGLTEREAKIKNRDRAAVLAADRKANADRLQETVAIAKKTSRPAYKAAGEYAIHDDDTWPLRKHPSPACRLMYVTPELADKMLAFNQHNRRMSKAHELNLRRDMESDEFILTHQGVAFDTNGVLLDGQHRLTAISQSGKTLILFVFVGIDPRAFAYIDIHRKRSSRDVLEMDSAPNAAVLGSVVRMVYLVDNYEVSEWMRAGINNRTVSAMYSADKERYDWATREAHNMVQAWRGFPASGIGALLYLAAKRGASGNDLTEFIDTYKWGENINREHPISVLRRYAKDYAEDKSRRVRNTILFGQLVMAWNAVQEGRTLRTLHRRYDDPIPPLSIRK